MTAYDLKSLNLPKLYGTGLDLFTALVENPAGRALLIGSLLENGGIPKLSQLQIDEAPTLYPLGENNAGTGASLPAPELADFAGLPGTGVPYPTIRQYAQAYRDGSASPLTVAEKVFASVAASENLPTALHLFIAMQKEDVLGQAHASTERIQGGQALSILDGVPVAIKDEIDMLPYPTTLGTCFLGKQPVTADATVAARLRAAGALLIGKTNMHEIGINPNGSNVNYGRVANPWDPRCDTGGSSSGSAAAVAAGVCPAAIGADGGGSIRIPSTLCGVVGLKPTFGRVSEHGAAPLGWSVAHLGPIGATVEDVAITYAAIAGPDPAEPLTLRQPSPTLAGWNNPDLHGVRLGVYPDWNRHADAQVNAACTATLAKLVEAGASVTEIIIPELDAMRIAHAITILAEMAEGMRPYRLRKENFAPSTRLSLVIGEVVSAHDYLQAQRMRTRAMHIFKRIFQEVDAIITPGTGLAAPLVPAQALARGWSDLGTDTELMRFIFPGNLVGLPAVVFPAGYTAQGGLPVGVQAMGRHWEEALLLRIAYAAEQFTERRKPGAFFPPI
jgi:Asp-tRNA(Asn)/Glu-tRNA(Gln) amidotransferase A subunit family amidase